MPSEPDPNAKNAFDEKEGAEAQRAREHVATLQRLLGERVAVGDQLVEREGRAILSPQLLPRGGTEFPRTLHQRSVVRSRVLTAAPCPWRRRARCEAPRSITFGLLGG